MEKFSLALAKTQVQRLHYFPASQSNIRLLDYFISLKGTFSGGTFFSASEHLSNQARQIARTVDFNILNVLGQYLLLTLSKY